MHGAPQGGRGKAEDMEGSPTDETDKGHDGRESPTDSGDSLATSCVSTSEEEEEADKWEVESESSHEGEITEEPMEEEDTESVASAMTDTTLDSVMSSSQEAGWHEDPLDRSHPAEGNGGAELASVKCGLDTLMVGGDATSTAHEEQTEGQSEPWTPPLFPMNSPKMEGKPSAEVPKSDQGGEVICYATEVELKSLD